MLAISELSFGKSIREPNMTPRQSALLRDLDEALMHWAITYAPDLCNANSVAETHCLLLDAGGSLEYISRLRQRIKAELKPKRKGPK
jgi:hypothetical protein